MTVMTSNFKYQNCGAESPLHILGDSCTNCLGHTLLDFDLHCLHPTTLIMPQSQGDEIPAYSSFAMTWRWDCPCQNAYQADSSVTVRYPALWYSLQAAVFSGLQCRAVARQPHSRAICSSRTSSKATWACFKLNKHRREAWCSRLSRTRAATGRLAMQLLQAHLPAHQCRSCPKGRTAACLLSCPKKGKANAAPPHAISHCQVADVGNASASHAGHAPLGICISCLQGLHMHQIKLRR